jgi:hypothetical protein
LSDSGPDRVKPGHFRVKRPHTISSYFLMPDNFAYKSHLDWRPNKEVYLYAQCFFADSGPDRVEPGHFRVKRPHTISSYFLMPDNFA